MRRSIHLQFLLKSSVVLAASAFAALAMANSPVGQWHTLDDKTGECCPWAC
jgi:hypothetical protein